MIGIGGAGMRGIAEVLLAAGHRVSGSDTAMTASLTHLQSLGAEIYHHHAAQHVKTVDMVVFSSAIHPDNIELQTALRQGIPIKKRAEMLALLSQGRIGIAVAGTHGKTTTTAMIAHVLQAQHQHPSFVVGEAMVACGRRAKLAQGRAFVFEADESDQSFLCYRPHVAVITNIQPDHMGRYNHDPAVLMASFQRFASQVAPQGLLVLCIDDDNVKLLSEAISIPKMTYGFSEEADLRASDVVVKHGRQRFVMHTPGGEQMTIQLPWAGRHHVLNALACYAVCQQQGVALADFATAIATFQGVKRRFERVSVADAWHLPHVRVFDDYGHHPNEIAATLQSVRLAWPDARLVMCFQPHRYSRTRDLFASFCQVLSTVDCCFVLPVFGCHEPAITGATSADLVAAITAKKQDGQQVILLDSLADALPTITPHLQSGDVLLFQGAGHVGLLAKALHAATPSTLASFFEERDHV